MDPEEKNPFHIPYESWKTVKVPADAEHDELTGLYNRRAFYRHAQEMIQQDPEADYCVILSDIENFKMINNRYGEKKGDELLRYIGTCLGAMNGEHVLFARFGGDQFVGLMRQIAPIGDDAETPIVESMQMLYQYAPVERFTVKFGIYDDVDHTLPISAMCDRAMMAVRSIKHQYGRTIAKYDQNMQTQYLREQAFLEYMEEALKKDQFQVYYQPKHSAQTGELIGAEALIRWIHPVFGFLAPDEFLPLFERNGFISRLDLYVLEKVCEAQNDWLARGLPVVPISVNAFRKDFYHGNCVQLLKKTLKKSALDPKLLHMEVTESLYIEDAEKLRPIIEEIRDLGIKVELDDFGSGYSSLAILNTLPLDIIKMDIGFVRQFEQQRLVIEAMIELMHRLGYQIVAEGVETAKQLEALREMGCDAVQGYYYSIPLPHDEFEEYVKRLQKTEN